MKADGRLTDGITFYKTVTLLTCVINTEINFIQIDFKIMHYMMSSQNAKQFKKRYKRRINASSIASNKMVVLVHKVGCK